MGRRDAPREHSDEAHPAYADLIDTLRLNRASTVAFDVRPDSDALERIAAFLEIPRVSSMRYKGNLNGWGEEGWRAEGRLTAKVEQSCVVTLGPVESKIDLPVSRTYVPQHLYARLITQEMKPSDEDDPDLFARHIDLGALAIEALALSLEPYPRAPGAAFSSVQAGGDTDGDDAAETTRPFAGLEALRARMSGK